MPVKVNNKLFSVSEFEELREKIYSKVDKYPENTKYGREAREDESVWDSIHEEIREKNPAPRERVRINMNNFYFYY
jgi:hypothetical protein